MKTFKEFKEYSELTEASRRDWGRRGAIGGAVTGAIAGSGIAALQYSAATTAAAGMAGVSSTGLVVGSIGAGIILSLPLMGLGAIVAGLIALNMGGLFAGGEIRKSAKELVSVTKSIDKQLEITNKTHSFKDMNKLEDLLGKARRLIYTMKDPELDKGKNRAGLLRKDIKRLDSFNEMLNSTMIKIDKIDKDLIATKEALKKLGN
jgi:hypothetical protein